MTYSYKTLPAWLNIGDHSRRNPGIGELPGIHTLNVLVHGAGVHKRLVVYHCDAVVHVLVYIGHIRDFIDGVVVVNVCDLDHADASVGHVYVLNVTRTGAIPGNENFLWSEWEPSDRSRSNTNSDAESSATDESNQSRRVDWTYSHRSRNPTPAALYKSPAAIVEGCKTPRLIFYPSPPPGRDVSPVAIPVRGPVARDVDRLPHISVTGD